MKEKMKSSQCNLTHIPNVFLCATKHKGENHFIHSSKKDEALRVWGRAKCDAKSFYMARKSKAMRYDEKVRVK